MISIAVTLKEGGTWWIYYLSDYSKLALTLNTGFIEGNQIFALRFDIGNTSLIYDFVLKQFRGGVK